jgi:hypothetical protein
MKNPGFLGGPNISAMEHGRSPIGKAMAKKIGEVLDFPCKALL